MKYVTNDETCLEKVEDIVENGENSYNHFPEDFLFSKSLTLSQTNPGFYVSAVRVF